MRINFAVLFLCLFLASCKEKDFESDTNITGKWNIDKYFDLEGNEYDTTYNIFIWYEQGFEFVDHRLFYPRHFRLLDDEWQTTYDLGPGTYSFTNDKIVLSYNELIVSYDFQMPDEDTIILSNDESTEQVDLYKGTWIFVRVNEN